MATAVNVKIRLKKPYLHMEAMYGTGMVIETYENNAKFMVDMGNAEYCSPNEALTPYIVPRVTERPETSAASTIASAMVGAVEKAIKGAKKDA
jgi:hypothetical protein